MRGAFALRIISGKVLRMRWNPLSHALRRASSPEGGAFWNLPVSANKAPPSGELAATNESRLRGLGCFRFRQRLPHKGGFGSAVKFPGRPQSLRVRLLPLGGAVAQRLRGFQSAEHKKSFSEATWIFCMEPNSFGIIKGEQPLIRASRASKVAGAFLVLFWHAKENIPGGNALAKGMKL